MGAYVHIYQPLKVLSKGKMIGYNYVQLQVNCYQVSGNIKD